MTGGWVLKEISKEIQGRLDIDINSMPVIPFGLSPCRSAHQKSIENRHARMAHHPLSDRPHCRLHILSSPHRGALELGCEPISMTSAMLALGWSNIDVSQLPTA
jgi:hypothetical protein